MEEENRENNEQNENQVDFSDMFAYKSVQEFSETEKT